MPNYRNMSKVELLDALHRIESSQGEQGAKETIEGLIEELHIHQAELEMQNQELRDARDELESARDRYQPLFDYAPVAYLIFDPKGNVVDMNIAAETLLGHDRQFSIGKPFINFVAAGYFRQFLSHLRQSLQSREQLITEFPLSTAGGQRIVQMHSLSVPMGLEQDPFCRSAMVDVTERRAVERRLQDSEERYRRLFYPVTDGVLLVDEESEAVIDNNAAAISLYNYSPRELIGLKLSSLFVNPQDCQTLLRSAGRSGTTLLQRREDGTTFPAELSVYRFIHGGRVVEGITVHDLTRQRRDEDAHRYKEDHFRSAIRNMSAFFAVYDQERRYRFVSSIAELWLQRTARDLEGHTDEERVSENVRQAYLSLLTDAYETRSERSGRVTFQTSHGPIEAIMKFTPVLDEKGQMTQLVAVGVEVGGASNVRG